MARLLLLALAPAGCGSDPPPVAGPPPGPSAAPSTRTAPWWNAPPSLTVELRASVDNVVSGFADVSGGRIGAVTIDYGDDPGVYGRTASAALAPSGTATVALLGLTPGALTHVRVTADADDGSRLVTRAI